MTDKQKIAHTPGLVRFHQPWAGFSKITGPNGELVFGVAVGAEEERQPEEICEGNARLFEAAFNSYDKHCGPRAVECAEGDLLGEALDALGTLCRHRDELLNNIDCGEEFEARERARAVLSKARGKQ